MVRSELHPQLIRQLLKSLSRVKSKRACCRHSVALPKIRLTQLVWVVKNKLISFGNQEPTTTVKCGQISSLMIMRLEGEVQESLSQAFRGATQDKIDTVSVGSEEQVDQFWQSGANDHREVWADQFFDDNALPPTTQQLLNSLFRANSKRACCRHSVALPKIRLTQLVGL